GTNDETVPGTAISEVEALLDSIRGIRSTALIVGCIPWVSSHYTKTEADTLRTFFESENVLIVDTSDLYPDGGTAFSSDGLHPNVLGSAMLADQIFITMSGDPIGALAKVLRRTLVAKKNGTVDGTLSVSGALSSSALNTGVGTFLGQINALANIVMTGGLVGAPGAVLGNFVGAGADTWAAYANGVDAVFGVHGTGVFLGGHRKRIRNVGSVANYTFVNA